MGAFSSWGEEACVWARSVCLRAPFYFQYFQSIDFLHFIGIAGAIILACGSLQTSSANESERDRPPVIPAWAFGHWIWEDSTHTRDAVEYMVSGYLVHGIPVGAVLFDSPWATTYNDFIWNSKGYPQAQDMIDNLHRRGIRVLTFYTGAINRKSNDTEKQKCDFYDFVASHHYAINDGRESSWWKGPALHLDFTNPEAVAWWQEQLIALHKMGVDGAKIDAAHARFGATVETSRGPMSNHEFGYYYFRTAFDFHTAHNPEFVAMTYAWSGMGLIGYPATSHVNWVGDFEGDWNGMKNQRTSIYRSVRDGFSGVACEVGGYWKTASNKQQFIRYAQLSSLCPIMINGGELGALKHHLPWMHDEETVSIYRDFVLLHYDLAPYLFSSGVDAHLKCTTILRNPSDETGSHELGPWLFVKTITDPQNFVHVQLPAGDDWVDFWDGTRHPGSASFDQTYSYCEYPLFVRAGAILPVAGRSRFFGNAPQEPPMTTFMLYPAGKSEYLFHEPLGTGTSYRDIQVVMDGAEGSLQVKTAEPHAFRFLIKTHAAPANVYGVDTWSYDENRHLLRIEKYGASFEIKSEGLLGFSTVKTSP